MANISLGFEVTGAFSEKVVPLTDGSIVLLDASLGNIFTLDAEGDRAIAAPSNPVDGQKIVIRFFADGADRTLTLNSGDGGFRFGSDITELTTTDAGATDYITCIYNLTDECWDVIGYVKGYASSSGIAFDSASHGTITNTVLTVSHTCSGTNRALLVGIWDNSNAVTGVTYNETSMTLAASFNWCSDGSPNKPNKLFYLVAPDTGTHNIVATSSTSNEMILSAASYTGASQDSNPIDVDGGSSDGTSGVCGGNVNSLSADLTSTVDNCWMILSGAADNGGILTAGTNAVIRDDGADGKGIFDSNGPISPAGLFNMEYEDSTAGHFWCVTAMLKPF